MILEALRVIPSAIGPIAIGASSQGLAQLEILAETDRRFEFSDNERSSKLLDLAGTQLNEYFAGTRTTFDIPLDLVGTEFQKSIWKRLLEIQFGQTKSYGELAAEISKPLAARAVGGAVGANPIPIIVPCHRVMGASGQLTGYSATGGLKTKAKLLRIEGISV